MRFHLAIAHRHCDPLRYTQPANCPPPCDPSSPSPHTLSQALYRIAFSTLTGGMVVPSNPPTAPSSPTPHAPALRPTAGRRGTADAPRHIAYIKDIQCHAPPAIVSSSLIVPSFLRSASRHVDDHPVPRQDDRAPGSGQISPSAPPHALGASTGAHLPGSSPPAGRHSPELDVSLRIPRYLDRLDPNADSDANMTTERGSSPPASMISSLALPRPIAALRALSDGPRLDLTAVNPNPNDGMYASDGDEHAETGWAVAAVPPVQSSLLARRASTAAQIPSSSPAPLFGNAPEPVPAIGYNRDERAMDHPEKDEPPAPASPSPEFNWAATLPHSLHGLRSLGTSTVRPPLRPDQLGITAGVHIGGLTRLSPGREAIAAEGGGRSAGEGSTARHLAEYKQILHKLGTELSVGSTTVRPQGPMGEDGVIRIGDATILRVGHNGRDQDRWASAEIRGALMDDEAGVGRMDVDELGVEWCWFCHCEFPRVDMALRHLDGDGDQWVCQGCDGFGQLGDGTRWRGVRVMGGGTHGEDTGRA